MRLVYVLSLGVITNSYKPFSFTYRRFVSMEAKSGPLRPLQIGLTGSIGMGKSSVSKQFQFLGFEVFDADAAVHELYSKGGEAVPLIRTHFPTAIVDGAVSRPNLSSIIMNEPSSLQVLESIVHPLVASKRMKFLEEAAEKQEFLVVYDIPLLLENREKHNVDYIIVVTAEPEVQRSRVLARPGMTAEKFESILSKQLPDAKKRELADFVIHTDRGEGFTASKAQLAEVLEKIVAAEPDRFERWKRRTFSRKTAQSELPFDVVAFDLDETLVPTMPPVMAAYDAKYAFMETNMPLSLPITRSTLRAQMLKVMEEAPYLKHDFSAARRVALLSIASEHSEDHHVDEAVAVFERARSDVEKHLYEDTLSFLRWLRSKGVDCCVLTNGSADLDDCSPNLRSLLTFSLNARDVGALKPSVVPFIAVAQRSGVPPHRILYVGDSYLHDVVGANKAGMLTALLTREAKEGIVYSSVRPDIELETLNPDVFSEKVEALKQSI